MAADSKNSRSQSRLEKAAREDEKVRVHYEVEARSVAEKTARLRALRLAKEAADRTAAASMPATAKRSKAGMKRPPWGKSLSEWLADQDKWAAAAEPAIVFGRARADGRNDRYSRVAARRSFCI